MDSRQRVYRALEFRSPDRAPRNLWYLPWVKLHESDRLGAFRREFPDDFAVPAGVLAGGDRSRGEMYRKGEAVDDWGCAWESMMDGILGEVKHSPLADDAALDAYAPPWEVIDRADWDAANRAQQANLAGDRKFMWSMAGVSLFERMQWLRGPEQLMVDLAYDTAGVRRLREMIHEFNCRMLARWAATDVDAAGFLDDWGAQNSLLISPKMWREVFKRCYREYCDLIHAGGKKVFFHSDGHITDIYEDLIEIGVDAINSQLFCMDIEQIGRRFAGRITFWGEIDRQWVLPFGTVDDVRNAVRRVRRALDDGRGGVIAQCEWGPNYPAENIRAVFETWNEPMEG